MSSASPQAAKRVRSRDDEPRCTYVFAALVVCQEEVLRQHLTQLQLQPGQEKTLTVDLRTPVEALDNKKGTTSYKAPDLSVNEAIDHNVTFKSKDSGTLRTGTRQQTNS